MSGLQFNFDLFLLLLGLSTFWSGTFYGDLDTKASFVVASSVHYNAIESRNVGEISAHRIKLNMALDVKHYSRTSSS